MPVATNDSFAVPAPRSEIDHRAIGVVGHLLMAGNWFECQFKNTAFRTRALQLNQPRNEEA
jgi:hypothetical protein